MARYAQCEADIFSIFGSAGWQAEGVFTVPSTIVPDKTVTEYIRVSVVPSGQGLNALSVRGVLLIDIFTPRNDGPTRTMQIADLLDSYIQRKSVALGGSATTQFLDSSLSAAKQDRDNPTLTMATYSVPFSYYGVY